MKLWWCVYPIPLDQEGGREEETPLVFLPLIMSRRHISFHRFLNIGGVGGSCPPPTPTTFTSLTSIDDNYVYIGACMGLERGIAGCIALKRIIL